MAFRVTNIGTRDKFIDQIIRGQGDLERVREELSSGLKVVNASDDPGRSGTIAGLISAGQRIDRHLQRIGFATNFLDAQENAVQSANNVMIRLQELATQAANGPNAPDVRRQIADEVFQLRDNLAALANSQNQGLYLFGGREDGDLSNPPFRFEPDYFDEPATAGSPEKGHWIYEESAGRNLTREVNISDNESIRINTPGNQIFQRALDAATRLGRALEGYQTAHDTADADGDGNTEELLPGSPPQLTFPDDEAVFLGEIHAALDELSFARTNDLEIEISSIGARVNRLQQTGSILESLKISNETTRAGLQETDPFEAASRFTQLQVGLEALLASGARINSLSLLNYI